MFRVLFAAVSFLAASGCAFPATIADVTSVEAPDRGTSIHFTSPEDLSAAAARLEVPAMYGIFHVCGREEAFGNTIGFDPKADLEPGPAPFNHRVALPQWSLDAIQRWPPAVVEERGICFMVRGGSIWAVLKSNVVRLDDSDPIVLKVAASSKNLPH